MKKLTLIFTLFACCMFCSCGDGNGGVSGSADDTMKSFIEKMKAQDFDAAQEFTTNATDGTLSFLKAKAKMQKTMDKEFEMWFAGIDFAQVEKAECTTKDNSATCKCCETMTGNCAEIPVIQEGGKWLINVPQETVTE